MSTIGEWSTPVSFTVADYGDEMAYASSLISPSPSADERFGKAISVTEDNIPLLSIGASNNSEKKLGLGCIYLLEHKNDNYVYKDRLYLQHLDAYSNSGSSISYSSEKVAIGCPGKNTVVILKWIKNNISNQYAFYPFQIIEMEGSTKFGECVRLVDDYLYISDPFNSDQETKAGCVYVYKEGLTGYSFVKKIYSNSSSISGYFGSSVEVKGNNVFVSSHCLDNDIPGNSGRVHFYEKNGDDYVFIKTITSPTPLAGDNFGLSLAYANDINTLFIGSPRSFIGSLRTGCCFVYDLTSDSYKATLSRPNAVANENFGTSIVLTNNNLRMFVGSPDYTQDDLKIGLISMFDRFD